MSSTERSRQNVIALAYNKRGMLIAIGNCRYDKTHPIQARFAKMANTPKKIYLHAEIDALIRAREKVHKMHIMRKLKNGKFGLAKPCPVCQLALEAYKVKVVTHT